jgi:hypothetical protein
VVLAVIQGLADTMVYTLQTPEEGKKMIKSCSECSQYVVKEIEPELPAFCLYWKEGLMLESPACRNYKEGRIPEEPVSPLSDLPTAAPHGGQAGSEDSQSAASLMPDQSSSSHGNDVYPGRHLVKIISVRAYTHNFQEYAGPRARLTMKVLEGPDAGKFLFDNVSLLHPQESKGMCQRRLRIAYRLGLISRGTDLTIPINWKLLEGVVCRVDVDYKSFGGRIVPMVDNYELIEYGAHPPSVHPLPLASAAANPAIEEHHDMTPPFPLETCESCPWYTLNPWTRDPALGAWCHYRMEHLVVGGAACEEFQYGEIQPQGGPS